MFFMDLRYFAGLFDGEGSVGIVKTKTQYLSPNYILNIRIVNTNKELLNQIKSQFGGSVVKKTKSKMYGENHNTCWVWITQTNIAKSILENILEYLIIKKEHAKLAIKFQNYRQSSKGGRKLEKTRLENYERYYLKMKELNKRGK